MMKKPKIAFLIPRLGIRDRGAEVVVYELAKRLQGDFEVTIFARRSKSKSWLVADLKKKGIVVKNVRCIAANSWFPKTLYSLRFLKKYLIKYHFNPDEIEMFTFSLFAFPSLLSEKIDILFPANGVWGAVAGRIIRLFKGTPFVYTSHGGIEPAIAMQKPDIYFALNRKIERWYKKHFPSLKVVFLPNGVDLKRFKPKGKKAKVNLKRPIYLAVGAFLPVKKLDVTIRAVAKLKKGSLMIIGDGPLKRDLIHLAKKELGIKRFLFKKIANHDIPAYYRTSDVFTHAAKGEPSSLVVTEALASNLPVVANDEELLRFLVGKAGILCNVENTVEYAKALKEASITDFSDKPRKQSLRHSWKKSARQYKNTINKVIHEH